MVAWWRTLRYLDACVNYENEMTKSRNCPVGTKGKHKIPRITCPARQRAIKARRSTYKNGTDCPRGHENPRRIVRTGYCLECNNADGRKWNAKNPEKRLAFTRAHAGLPLPTRPDPGSCECCRRIPNHTLRLDHDHETGKFRGWLCSGCNTGLGNLGDNLRAVLRALAYLRRANAS